MWHVYCLAHTNHPWIAVPIDDVWLSSTMNYVLASQNMNSLFVVLSYYMNGKDAEKVFSSKKAALAYMNSRNDDSGNPQIEEFLVSGKIKDNNFVYTSATYDKPNDIHWLVGVYGNYDEANEAEEKSGLVLRIEINS